MDNETRDRLITETHTDIKWLKDWTVEHKATHRNYLYMLVGTIVATIIGWFKFN